MRRIGQQIANEECFEILSKANTGVLGVNGDDGYPYTVPINFVFKPGKDGSLGTITFHGAKEGHKIDSISELDGYSGIYCLITIVVLHNAKKTKRYTFINGGKNE